MREKPAVYNREKKKDKTNVQHNSEGSGQGRARSLEKGGYNGQ